MKWVSLADSSRLDRRYINDTVKKISALGLRHSSAVLHPKGTVIVSRDAGVGKSAMLGDEMAVSQHFIAWECDEKRLHREYLYQWLQSHKPEFERIAVGSTVKTIGLRYFENLRIPLPPIGAQVKVAAILAQWDAAIEKAERLIAAKEQRNEVLANQLLFGQIRFGQHDVPAGLVSPIYTVFQADATKIDDGYLYKLLKTEKLRQIFAANTNASVDRRGSLRWKKFARIHIPLPLLAEQQQISALLDEAKREVSLLQAQVEALKTQKRGLMQRLMQKLLTGQWRVRADEAEVPA